MIDNCMQVLMHYIKSATACQVVQTKIGTGNTNDNTAT